MDKEELIKLLDNRPGAWLGRKMGYARPKETVNRWVNGHAKIPNRRVPEIRIYCKPAGQLVEGLVITNEQVDEIIEYIKREECDDLTYSYIITHICGQGYDWTHMNLSQRDKIYNSITKRTADYLGL